MATSDFKNQTEGVLAEHVPSQRIPITKDDTIWVVESGKVDLFLQTTTDASMEGSRHHILRVEAGEAFFGFCSAERLGLKISAVTLPGATLIQIPQAEWLEPKDWLRERDTQGMLETWIARLAAIVAGDITPKKFLALTADQEITIGDDAEVIAPIEDVLWVEQIAGNSRFLSGSEMSTEGVRFFPVSKCGWLEVAPESRIRVVGFRDIMPTRLSWAGLQLFHEHICSRLIANLRSAENHETERLKIKDASVSASVNSALSDLAAALEPHRTVAVELDPLSSPLLLACQSIGKTLGVNFHAPPDSKLRVKQKDPVMAIAKVSSVRVRQVLLKDNWWTRDLGPMVAFREADNSPVALLPETPQRYKLYNPMLGESVTVNPTIAGSLSGIAYSFYQPFPQKKIGLIDLLLFGFRPAKRDLLTVFFMGLGGGLLNLLVPITTGILFDSAIPGSQRGQILVLSLFLLVGAIASGLLNLTRGFAVLRLQGKMDATIQAAVWDRLLRLPVPFFRGFTSGDLALRSMAIDEIRVALTGSVISSMLSGLFSMFSFGLLFYYSWQMAILATLLTGVTVAISTGVGYLELHYQRKVSNVQGRIAGMVLEFVNGIAKFRVTGSEGRAFGVWAKAFAQQKQISLRARRVALASTVFNSMVPILCWAAMFFAAARILSVGSSSALTTGDFLAFFIAFNQFLTTALQLSTNTLSVLKVVPLYERAKPILESAPEVDAAKTPPGELIGEIEISNVVFRYNEESPLVLRGLTMSIAAGEFVAVIGQSGCGKSTLLRLLLGFEKQESGSIYFDDQDLSGLDVQAVRQQIGVILQSGRLAAGTVLSNIIGSAALTAEDAWEAARMAGMEDDIKSMPMGLHTVISEGGGTLSGGQRQRLMIARAVVNKPRILLFDEATSALDNETQAIVSRSLESLRATRIVIAHRLSTIINADKIFVLEKGVVVQCGKYQELMEQGGLFSELAKRQIV